MNNPIIDEIREARAALAAEHDYDLVRINAWARQQTESRRSLQTPRANQALPATGGAARAIKGPEAPTALNPFMS